LRPAGLNLTKNALLPGKGGTPAIVKHPDGSVSLGGQRLPPGVTVCQSPDGTLSLVGAEGATLPAGLAVRTGPNGTLTVVAAPSVRLPGSFCMLADFLPPDDSVCARVMLPQRIF